MGNKLTTAQYIIVMAVVLLAFPVFGVIDLMTVKEIKTYSAGYEISHMELSQRNNNIGFISIRNDEESTTLTVDKDVYAGYAVGEVVEVETVIMEYKLSGDTYTEYRLVSK